MSQAIPAPLCTLILPSGRRCGAPALRGKRFCYHHAGKHLDFTRERRLSLRLERLENQLANTDTAGLLSFLHQQLNTLPKTLSRFPEVSLTLTCALARLDAITTLESIPNEYTQQNQQFAAYFKRVSAESMYYSQNIQN